MNRKAQLKNFVFSYRYFKIAVRIIKERNYSKSRKDFGRLISISISIILFHLSLLDYLCDGLEESINLRK